ncbi:MAG: PBECR4 domain-containing protein [Lachnospirales bacterium]
MNKLQEKIQITKDIINSAQQYKNFLLGKTFLYVFNNKYIEISFRKIDFAHLTGVDKHLSAQEFYKEAIRGTLRANQIFFF